MFFIPSRSGSHGLTHTHTQPQYLSRPKCELVEVCLKWGYNAQVYFQQQSLPRRNWMHILSLSGQGRDMRYTSVKANHLLPRRQTALKGTLGQRTANTQGCGSSLACKMTSITASASCHGNGCKGWIGNWSSANCLRYIAARLVASEPPSNCSKTFASSFHPFVVSGFKLRRPISPGMDACFFSFAWFSQAIIWRKETRT